MKGRKNKGYFVQGYFWNVTRVCEGEGENEDESDKEDDGEEEDEGEGEHEVTLALVGSPELVSNEQKNYMTDWIIIKLGCKNYEGEFVFLLQISNITKF